MLDCHQFVTSEQAYMYRKAKFFGDDEIAALILNTASPHEQKLLGRRVKGFDVIAWSAVCDEHMYEVCMAKFTQDTYYRNEILKYVGKRFVEASRTDDIWGIKMDEDHPDILDESKWMGQNRLGKVLDRVQYELLTNQHAAI